MLTTKSSINLSECVVEVDNPKVFKWADVLHLVQKQIPDIKSKSIIKINIVKSTKSKLYFYVCLLEGCNVVINEPFIPSKLISNADSDDIVCLIVPTGVGASIGGYAGDSNPLAKLISYGSKYFLTHPNVVNGAVLTDLPKNLIYLEGFLLDQFLVGKVNLIQERKNKIGVIFDSGIDDERLQYEINVLNATKAIYGCEILGWAKTEKPLNITPELNKFGFSTGKINNLECLIDKALLLKKMGATSIAICAIIPDLPLNNEYISGRGVDPIGGVESIISHAVSSVTGLVSAHAPVLLSKEKVDYSKISPVSAGEYVAQTFLPSVINGLRYAPRVVLPKDSQNDDILSFNNISKLIVPSSAFGSAGVLFLNEISDKVVLVKENRTCLEVHPEDISMDFNLIANYRSIIDKKAFDELGIEPEIFKRPLSRISELSD